MWKYVEGTHVAAAGRNEITQRREITQIGGIGLSLCFAQTHQ